MSGSLKLRTVFLGASFPSGERGAGFEPYDPAGIGDAVSTLARALLDAGATLVFGAHPTISPLVLYIAHELDARGQVVIYQSEYFRSRVPRETLALHEHGYGLIVWTPEVAGDAGASVTAMRR